MALEKTLDKCFAETYVPHVYELIYEYAFNLRNTAKLPKLTHSQLIKKNTNIVVDRNGYMHYYVNKKLHREDGPAVTHANGYKSYHIHGKLHRLDGPAIVWSDGAGAYYIDGWYYKYEDFVKSIRRRCRRQKK